MPTAGNSTPAPKKLVSNVPKKPEGISREVYALIGDNSPSLVQQYAAPKLKQKPTFGKSQAAKPKEETPATKWQVNTIWLNSFGLNLGTGNGESFQTKDEQTG